MGKKRKLGEQDKLYVSSASSAGVISQPPDTILIDRYNEKQKLLMNTIKQLQDPANVDNMVLLRNAVDSIKVMAQTTQRIHSDPSQLSIVNNRTSLPGVEETKRDRSLGEPEADF
jgi:hypothetical protein